MNDLYPVYSSYEFDMPNEESETALDRIQMDFVELLRLRKEGKPYDTFKLAKHGPVGIELMRYIDGMDEEEAAKHGPTTDPYDAMVEAAMLQEIFERR